MLTAAERASRIAALFTPYHDAIAGVLDRRAGQPGVRPSLLLSIHSFTPVLAGERRPWQISFSHGRDRRLAALMLTAMRHGSDFAVGDNQPYSVDDIFDYTIPVHGEGRGLAHVLIEIRQDGLTSTAGAGVWAERLAAAYRRIEAAALRS
jgi:predicted N-formylglutamate amidohydrolase